MENKIIDIQGFDSIGNTLYFSARDLNGIFSMDINTGIVEFETISEKYKIYNGYLYKDVLVCTDQIWFAPYSADNILIYHVKNKTCEYIEIPKLKGHGRSFVKFCGIYDYGEWLILIPAEFPAILRVNKESHAITAVNWEEELLKRYPDFIEKNKYIGISSWSYEIFNGILFLFASNVSIKYEINTNRLELCQINSENRAISGIARYGDVFALADRNNGELMLWDEKENKIIGSYDLGHKGINAGDDGGAIWLFNIKGGLVAAQSNDTSLKYLDSSGLMQDITINIDRKEKGVVFSEVKQKGSKLIIPIYKQGKILTVNTYDWSQQCFNMRIESLKQFVLLAKKEDSIQENSLFYGLNDLIKDITQYNKAKINVKNIQSVGQAIYYDL